MDNKRDMFKKIIILIIGLVTNYLWVIKTINTFENKIGNGTNWSMLLLIISIGIIIFKTYKLCKVKRILNPIIDKFCWGLETLCWIILIQIDRYLITITQNDTHYMVLIIISLMLEISLVTFIIIKKYYCTDDNKDTMLTEENKQECTEIKEVYFEIEDLYLEDEPLTWQDNTTGALVMFIVFGSALLISTLINSYSSKGNLIINLSFYLVLYILGIILETKLIRAVIECINRIKNKDDIVN